MVATIGGLSAEDALDEEREIVEQAVHCYLLSGVHARLWGRWRELHAQQEADFRAVCAALVPLSWDEWQVPPSFRGQQDRSVARCRQLHTRFATPLEMGQELAAITVVVLDDSVVSANGGDAGLLAAEASADLLLPLLMRVIALSAEAGPGSSGEGALFLTVLAYVRDFGCPSMGFSNVAYAAASFEAATEFIASGACAETFCSDAA